MRLVSTLALLTVLTAPPALRAQQAAEAPPRYSEVRIPLANRAALQTLAARVPLDHVGIDKTEAGLVAVTVLSESDLAELAASGFAYEVSVPDLAAAYQARAPFTEAERQQALAASRVDGFGFGSMGGYYTFDEVVAKLDEMAAHYPSLITEKVSIGRSHEGRDIWAVKISDNPNLDEDEPEVFYTGLHHAREPQSMATVVYYMFYLLENYGTNLQVTNLVNSRELYFVPVLNPDGYVYNQQTNPNGGGYWRKNRRNNGGSRGVDLNRNYSYEWGRDDQGSSPNGGSETYRGPAPFSEPETSAIRAFLINREIRGTLNYHSYSNVLLHPWGYEEGVYTPDQDLFELASAFLTHVNGYEYGQAADVLYPANGDSDDYGYGEQAEKNKIFSWTPEVGSFFQGFWPRQSAIIPLAEINRVMNLRLAQIAGFYPAVVAFEASETHGRANGYLDPGEAAAATVTLVNVGLEGRTNVRVRVTSADPSMPVEAGAYSEPFDLASGASIEIEGLTFTLSADAPLGLQDGLGVEFAYDDGTLVEAVEGVAIGTPVALFEDAAASADAWDTGAGWGLADRSTSAPTSLADSPAGSYRDDAENALALAEPLDLSESVSPVLRFRAQWDVEAGYDVVQVRASTDGATWTPLRGRYTSPGSGNGRQAQGEPGYDGTQAAWVEEQMDLRAFAGAPEVWLQVVLRSDGSVTGDGFYLDDLAVESFTNGNPVATEGGGAQPGEAALFESYPNPFAERTLIPFELPEAGAVSLAVYDVLGHRVRLLADGVQPAGRHSVSWDGRDGAGQPVASGVYVCALRAAGTVVTRKLLVVR